MAYRDINAELEQETFVGSILRSRDCDNPVLDVTIHQFRLIAALWIGLDFVELLSESGDELRLHAFKIKRNMMKVDPNPPQKFTHVCL